MLGDAQVVVGDGTVKVMFKNGRAMVSEFEAALLHHRGDIEIPGFTGELQPREVSEAAPIQAGGLPAGAVINGDGSITLSASSLTDEQREAVRQALEIAPVVHETSKPSPGDEAALAAAQEYLAEEGMEVEPVAEVAKTVTIPEGFEAKTAEGESRCIARTASGSQCSNPAKGDSVACGLAKHQQQVSAG
jgi:hypothetical protein